MKNFIISIAAQDHPGIVAGISEAIKELSGNIEAASQTVHQGYFAMILLGRFPREVDEDAIGRTINARAGADLNVYVTEYRPPKSQDSAEKQPFIVTSLGPDQPGILRAITSYLSSRNINIDDLYAKVQGNDFIVICQVAVPNDIDVYMIQADLEAIGQERGLTVQMQHENIFVATNELRFGRVS